MSRKAKPVVAPAVAETPEAKYAERRERSRAARVGLVNGMVRKAIGVYEDARLLAQEAEHGGGRYAPSMGHPSEAPTPEEREDWASIEAGASCYLRDAGSALCDVIVRAFDLLAPPELAITHAMEVERDRATIDGYTQRGFRLGDVVYLVNSSPDNFRDNIITRAEIKHVLPLLELPL